MDVPREVDTDLENLNQNILRGGTDDFFRVVKGSIQKPCLRSERNTLSMEARFNEMGLDKHFFLRISR